MIDPQQLWCDAAKAEYDEMAKGHWSQSLDKLARRAWHNGCTWVEKPIPEGTGRNWGAPERQPPTSYSIPGDPSDRQPGVG